MKLEAAIKEKYGVRIPRPTGDGELRRFRIDKFRLGFVISVGESALFGCWSARECWLWSELGCDLWQIDHKDSIDKKKERIIVEIARSQISRGNTLSEEDESRLELAVNRLEEWV